MKGKTHCCWSPTLGALESTHQKVWGTETYDPKKHSKEPCVFFGLYSLNDFYTLWRHKGKRYILWAGTDITHFHNGYWLDDEGKIRIDKKAFAKWIDRNCHSWCENVVEQQKLKECGIRAKVKPSFLGDINKFKVTFKPKWPRPDVYASVSGDNFHMYGWDLIERIADKCDVTFHLYGNRKDWKTKHKNVIVHGRVRKEVMNKEISEMQSGLRVLPFDGFSEVLAKSVLMGQYPISKIPYPNIDTYKDEQELVHKLNMLKFKTRPNSFARDYYIKNLNKFPWCI